MDYEVHRDVDGKVTYVSSSDGTNITPVRDVDGRIIGYNTSEPDKSAPGRQDPEALNGCITFLAKAHIWLLIVMVISCFLYSCFTFGFLETCGYIWQLIIRLFQWIWSCIETIFQGLIEGR